MRPLFRIFCLVILVIFSACGSDDGGNPGPQPEIDIEVTAVQAIDSENSGDASDIKVSFKIPQDESSVDHYRVFVVKTSATGGFDLATAQTIPARSFVRIDKTGSAISTNLSATALDSDGGAVVESVSYRIFILSVGITGVEGVLSSASAQLTLAKTDIVEILAELPIGLGGLVVDADGNIYSADFGASLSSPPGTSLYKITPEGSASLFASGFTGASGNTIGPDGNIYQSNIGNGLISKVTMAGQVSGFVSAMKSPVGLVFDPAGNLYVCNCGDNTVKKVTPALEVTTFASGSIFSCPNGIAIDETGNLYVANFGNGRVVKITPDGTASGLATLPGSNNGHLTYFEGRLYVVAIQANQVYEVTLGGATSIVVGSGARGHREGAAQQAELSLPNDLGFSPDGKFLYINDGKPTAGGLFKPSYIKKVRLEKD